MGHKESNKQTVKTQILCGISSGPALFAKIKTNFRDINSSYFKTFDLWPLETQNGWFPSYCINMYGTIHQNEKGYDEC